MKGAPESPPEIPEDQPRTVREMVRAYLANAPRSDG